MDETERADERFRDLETRSRGNIFSALLESQGDALAAVRAILPDLDLAVEAAAARIVASATSRLIYCGAGTSGRLAMLDGVELGPTFGWADERCVFLAAGGPASLSRAQEGAEDDVVSGRAAVAERNVGRDDVVIALAASGRTPFTLAVVEAARERGALTIAFSNNAGTPLLAAAEHSILLRTGREVLAGSTRLAAGTSQKVALNLFSTALMIDLGKVFRGRMVDMRPTNDKLQRRAVRMVAEVTGRGESVARDALKRCHGRIRDAILDLEADG